MKKIFLALILLVSVNSWATAPAGSCGDLSLAKVALTKAQKTYFKSEPGYDYSVAPKEVALSTTQIRNLRIQLFKILTKGQYPNFRARNSANFKILENMAQNLPVSIDYSLKIMRILGREKWNQLIAEVTTGKDQKSDYAASVFADRVLFALPNRELEVLGRDRQQSIYETNGNRFEPSVEQGTWLHLRTESYNTPYRVFRDSIASLNLPEGSVVVDMGSGLGRMGMVVGAHFPQFKYVGYEFHEFRLRPSSENANAFGFDNVQYIQADFSSPELNLVDGDVFFFYYPNNNPGVMAAAMEKIHQIAKRKKVRILIRMSVGGGGERAPWLKQVGWGGELGLFESTY
jgi:hypothetical protein